MAVSLNHPEASPAEQRRLFAHELDRLLAGLAERYGYDFRNYARASLTRRIRRAMQSEGVSSITSLHDKLLADTASAMRFVASMSVHTTAMFRDPDVYRLVRSEVVPMLRTYPFVRIWHAGCSSGEEVYSLAIMLEEEGLYDRCRIYATDISDGIVERARQGVFPLRTMREHTQAYQRAGGVADFSSYYVADHQSAMFRQSLRRQIVFSQHNLVCDSVFNEFAADRVPQRALVLRSDAARTRVSAVRRQPQQLRRARVGQARIAALHVVCRAFSRAARRLARVSEGAVIVALGSSLGGLRALQTILSGLPERLGASVVIVQHRRADPDSHLLSLLARSCRMPVIQPEDKTPLELNHVYLAPGDYHLLVEAGWLALSVDAPVSFARPSIDVLFESVADAYRPAAIGVMLHQLQSRRRARPRRDQGGRGPRVRAGSEDGRESDRSERGAGRDTGRWRAGARVDRGEVDRALLLVRSLAPR